MKPQHQLMLRKLGKGKGLPPRTFKKGEMRTHDVREGELGPSPSIEKLTQKMEGMGVTKSTPKSVVNPPKRKPLKFKL